MVNVTYKQPMDTDLFALVLLTTLFVQFSSSEMTSVSMNSNQGFHFKGMERDPTQCCLPNDEQLLPEVKLLNHLGSKYLNKCSPAILYDELKTGKWQIMSSQLLSSFPLPFSHNAVRNGTASIQCDRAFTSDIKMAACYIIIGRTLESIVETKDCSGISSKIIAVTDATDYQIAQFLSVPSSHIYQHLLIVPAFRHWSTLESNGRQFINLYTHHFYTDSLGSSAPLLLTSWGHNKLSRANIDLFAPKKQHSFNGYRFTVALAPQPPFVFYRSSAPDDAVLEGLEIRLLRLISEMLNFTLDFKEAMNSRDQWYSPAKRVLREVASKRADIGVAGIYANEVFAESLVFSYPHTQDCAVFVSLASLALPKYQAIMGPFRWEVWLALTFTYLLAIVPITLSEQHSIVRLLKNPIELEKMFWFVFATFTNAFSIPGKEIFNKSKMSATRLFIGTYWVFTIIVTAAYTGSIIAFIMLPQFPAVIDTPHQLLEAEFRVATLGTGWQEWFGNSSDPEVDLLFNGLQIVPTIEHGLRNVTSSKWYLRKLFTFLGAKQSILYTIKRNAMFSVHGKRNLFHLSKECFVPLMPSMAFSSSSILYQQFNRVLLMAYQTGYIAKIARDVEWEIGKLTQGAMLQHPMTLLKAGADPDRKLSLDDTQGPFLLLGAGFAIAFTVLILEFCYCYIWLNRLLIWSRLKDLNYLSKLLSK